MTSYHAWVEGVENQMWSPVKDLDSHGPQRHDEWNVQKAIVYHANQKRFQASFQIEGSECQCQKLPFPEAPVRLDAL
jgi:hypothetical protein